MSEDHDHAAAVAIFGECPRCGTAKPEVPETPPEGFDFAGDTYDADQDRERLGAQARRVLTAVIDEDWHSLAELAAETGDPEASISARLRDFRKIEFGAWDVERRRRPGGEWEYRVRLPATNRGYDPAP